MSEEETILIEKIRTGDQDALFAFITMHEPHLLAFIEKNMSDILKRKVESVDILQEVRLNAVESLGEVDLSERAPFSWLCHLSERRIIDAHRKYVGAQKRSAKKEVGLQGGGGDSGEGGGIINLLVASMTTPSAAFTRGQREYEMVEAMKSLPSETQDVIRMRFVEGKATKEIAEVIGKSDVATRVLVSRSMTKLREILSQNSLFQSLLPPEE